MKQILLFLFAGSALISCSMNSTKTSTAEHAGKCTYDKHSIYIQVDSIVPTMKVGPDDTTACNDCHAIYYHTLNGQRLISGCVGRIGEGENILVNGPKYFTDEFINNNDIVAKETYLMKIEEIVEGNCLPCQYSFTKSKP